MTELVVALSVANHVNAFLTFTVSGIFAGAAYAIAASGLVLTYSTTRVFNIGHGAVAMVFAFLYWELSANRGWPVWLSMLLVLLVFAPLAGILIQRVFGQGLGNAPTGVSLVVTVGLMVGLIGLAQTLWPVDGFRALPELFDGKVVDLSNNWLINLFHIRQLFGLTDSFSVVLTVHEIITIFISVLVAGGLYFMLNQTRIGTAMRASVDNPELLQLYGGRPKTVDALAWAIGVSLAALAGILLAPSLGLDHFNLTLMVISAFAAAVLGKLVDLRLTFIGAMGLGIVSNWATGYITTLKIGKEGSQFAQDFSALASGFRLTMPAILLFIILVMLPQVPLRIGQTQGLVAAPVPTLRKAGIWGAGMIVAVAVIMTQLDIVNQSLAGEAIVAAMAMVSLVLLTGYGGFVSLAQFTFVGVGALAYIKFDQPNLLGLAFAAIVTAIVGGIVALAVLRLSGLYLALATLAFAQIMEELVIKSPWGFEAGNALLAKRLRLFGVNFDNRTGAFVVILAITFVVLAIAVLAVRHGRAGRMLIAMRDSQTACGTLGLDQRWFRVALFSASTGIAGLSGALLASLYNLSLTADKFRYFNSLLLLLLVVVWGVTSITGAILGGIFFMLLPLTEGSTGIPWDALLFVVIGFGAIALGRDPNGLANRMFSLKGWLMGRGYPWLQEKYPSLAFSGRDRNDTPAETLDISDNRANESYELVDASGRPAQEVTSDAAPRS